MNKINFVGGDKLLPVFKHDFLRSEENVFPVFFFIFFRPEEAMFENWQKLVSSYKIDLVQEKITFYIIKTR